MRQFLFFLLTFLLFQIPQTAQTPEEPIVCEGVLPSRLVPDMIARVTPGSPNRVRNAPSTEGELIGDIPGEGEFYVLNGPVCADGFAWWYVEHEGLVGWTVEGGDDYWLEPVNEDFVVYNMKMPVESYESFEFNGLKVEYANILSDGVAGEIVPALSADEATFSFDVTAEHTLVDFQLEQRFYGGYLRVYDAESYEIYRETSLDNLRVLLEERPNEPTLEGRPIINAGMPIVEREAYVDFVGGSGVRALVHWTQNFNLITDGGLHYMYAGLTDDGQYLVHFVFPIDSDRLPHYFTVIGDNWDYEAFEDVYGDYMDVMSDVVAALPPESFSPELEVLDQVIESLDLTNFNQETLETSDGETCVTLRSRLIVDEFAQQALAQDSLRVRSEPGGESTGENVFPGDLVAVLSGPVCFNDVAWWEIESDEGWTGWVAEASGNSYFFAPITRTPLPSATPTITPTFTPSPIPTRGPTQTATVSDCIVTVINQTWTRLDPSGDSRRSSIIQRGTEFYAIGQYQRQGEGFPWWLLGSRLNHYYNTSYNTWIRADFVTEEGDCDNLPIVDPI